MSRQALAVALCFTGIALVTLGGYLILGPVALLAMGAVLATVGAFAIDVDGPSRRGS